MSRDIATAWDEEYRAGRYRRDLPVAFTRDILEVARRLQVANEFGLYVGCGNGRNYVPLVEAGLDLIGLDISAVAIEQIRERLPERRAKLLVGDVSKVGEAEFALVIGIQVFQHGTRDEAHDALRQARARVRPGGLFALRVNAVGTDVWPAHEPVERAGDGGFTVRYLAGAKAGLNVHFYSDAELRGLFEGWSDPLPLRFTSTPRRPPAPGQWSQWEAIYQAPTAASEDVEHLALPAVHRRAIDAARVATSDRT